MSQKERISDLNKFFSKVTYDYYNIPMAILLSFYNNKFKQMTYPDLLKDILSRKDAKKKLRKSTGEEYSAIELALKNLLNSRKKIFKKTVDDDENEPKYSILLDRAQKLWEYNSFTMSKLKQETNKSQSKISKHKNFLENDSDEKMRNKIYNGLLSKKRKRKNFVSDVSDDEESKEEYLPGFSIYHPKGYKSNHKSSRKKGSRSISKSSNSKSNCNSSTNSVNSNENDYYYEEEEINDTRSKCLNKLDKLNKIDNNGYLSDDLGKHIFSSFINNGRANSNCNLKSILDKNIIYKKIPQTDEKALNTIIDKFNKLGQKIKEIQSDLKSLVLSKTIKKYFNENNQKEDKQKKMINEYYETIISLMENKKYNPDNFKGQSDILKKSMFTFLDIYENSRDNLLKILYERSNILDNLLNKKEEQLQKDFDDCFNHLKKFINSNKKQINESYQFLNDYSRNYYFTKFGSVIHKIEEKHKTNMKEIEEANKIKEKLLLNKTMGKNVKFFNVQKYNNGASNNKNEINIKELEKNNNVNNTNNIINHTNNNIFSTQIIDYTEYNRDAPPPGKINFRNNKKIIQNFEALYIPSFNKRNNKIIKDEYSDMATNNNNENNDSNDNFQMSDNSKTENKIINNNNENEIYGENEKFDIESNNMSPITPQFYQNEFSVGSENNC